MTATMALAAGTVAIAGAKSITEYSSARGQASRGRDAASMRMEQLSTERQVSALQAREQEVERQRRAEITDSAARAQFAAFGLDADAGSAQQLRTENERTLSADVGSIRMMGAARQRQLFMATRAAQLERDTWRFAGSTAWVRPTMSFLGSAMSAGMSMAGPGAPASPNLAAGPGAPTAGMSIGNDFGNATPDFSWQGARR